MNIYRSLSALRGKSSAAPSMSNPEDVVADAEEPHEEQPTWPPPSPLTYTKAPPLIQSRRESLLTRQLHSETEHSEEEHQLRSARNSISCSTWSGYSLASTAELTSDDGKSVASPTISPPLAATWVKNDVPVTTKPLDKRIKIVGQDDVTADSKDVDSERSIEVNLGRRRCITFACGNKADKPKETSPVTSHATSPSEHATATPAPPKRKCMIQFVCPNKPSQPQASDGAAVKRPVSPPPSHRTALSVATKSHRGSDSTVTHASPKSLRKVMPASPAPPKIVDIMATIGVPHNAIDSDDSGPESTRFHEFATSDEEPEAWTQESTVHRSRLTISDTLRKENVIRRACEEVEEEAIEEEADEDEEEDEDDDDMDDLGRSVDLEHHHAGSYLVDEESEDSDDGFHSDDEEGFAASDSDDGDSDYEWWKPGGPSTAATSVDHLDRLSLVTKSEDVLASSLGSVSSGQLSPRSSRRKFHKSHRPHKVSRAVCIPRPASPELPDSTDFVAGTLDEDRPLEQAYINNIKGREAAKHRARPQDIDPTFPTSDPEMDEEDDEDLVDPSESDGEEMVHGDLDDADGGSTVTARRPSRMSRHHANRSPAPTRLRSPPPPARHHSPAPKRRTQHHSPPPAKHAGHRSPRRLRSPAPPSRKTSPTNTRPTTPAGPRHTVSDDTFGLPQRANVTHTASLPRGGAFRLSTMVPLLAADDEDDENDTTGLSNPEPPKRGAIDIVKGLERKRQRRREKLHQKMCAKAAAKGEKAYKVKPGRGAERMREVGLELQRYKGKGEHILSI